MSEAGDRLTAIQQQLSLQLDQTSVPARQAELRAAIAKIGRQLGGLDLLAGEQVAALVDAAAATLQKFISTAPAAKLPTVTDPAVPAAPVTPQVPAVVSLPATLPNPHGDSHPVAPPINPPMPTRVARWDGKNEYAAVWTGFAIDALHKYGTRLLAIEPSDIGKFCFNFPKDPDRRLSFWVFLVSCIAEFESSFDPKSTFTEPFQDSVGKPQISAGLLQLSLDDGPNLHFQLNGLADLLNPSINLALGVKMLDQLVGPAGVISAGDATGKFVGAPRYWSVMRPSGKLSAIQRLCLSRSF